MTDKIDLAAMYAAALPQRTRENLLAQYCDYISLVRNLENVVRRYKPAQLAAYQINSLFSKEDENPWSVEKTDRDERAAYDSFVANEPPAPDTHYCFVSLNRTSPRFAGEGPGIFSMPESFATYGVSHSLPARVERCVAAFRKEEKLKDAVFLVGGRWKMRYQNEHGDRLLSEAFEDEKVAKSYEVMMDLLTLLPEDQFEYEDRELLAVQTEAMASQLIAPFENVLLSSFAALSEESNEALKKILGKRVGSNFISQAENEGLIGSAAVLQDGMNIRHLMHHQWDTLDGMGKFNEWATVKNNSLRRRFLDSYARLCDKPILERLNAYADAAAGFTPLITALNPDFLVRGKNESNNKFMTRLKEYRRTRPAPSSRPAKKKISSRPYIEEYPNGTGIGVCGTEITSCRLPNGVLVNLRAGNMAYPDGSKFYFGMETHNSLTVKGGVRLITDKDFKVQNYILNGKSVNIAKNESAKFPNSHGFALDKHGYLQSEEFLSGGGQVVKMSFQKGGEVPQIRFSDGTVLRLSPEKPVLSHAGIELSYRSRKAFAESYFDGGNGGHGNSGNGGIFPPGGGRGGR